MVHEAKLTLEPGRQPVAQTTNASLTTGGVPAAPYVLNGSISDSEQEYWLSKAKVISTIERGHQMDG